MTEEDPQQETLPGEVVHPESNVKNCARITSKEIVRSRRVIVGISRLQNWIGMQIRR